MAVAIVLVVAAPGSGPAFASTPKPKSAARADSHSVAAAASHTKREVFGFALASSLADPSFGYPSWNFDLLSTVAFFGLHTGSDGGFAGDPSWFTWNSSTLTSFVTTAHQHGTKVVLTVVLQDFSPNTPDMCAGLQHADATVAATLAQVRAKGVDGVNIDYEGLDGSCGTTDPYWAQHAMTTFAAKMRAGLGSSYYLSVDTYASSASDGYGFFDVAGLASYVDSFFVMAYDLEYSNYRRSPSSCPRFCLGPTAPLTGYYYNDTSIAAQYVSAVGAGKVILGVPYYGRKACVGGAVANGFPTSGVSADSYLDATTEASDPAVGAGSYAAHRDAYSSGTERWDTWYNTSLGCTRELYWDDAVSLGKKYDLVNADNLRGAGIWNLNYGGGAPELWSALASHFAACASVSVAASPASPQVAKAQTVTLTATSTGCTNPLYQFWFYDGAAWNVLQPYSTKPTFSWNTAGAPPGSWTLSVWVRALGSPGSMPSSMGILDADVMLQYRLTSFCSSVTVGPAPGPVTIGSAVTVNAVASGCPSPLYQFVMRPAGSGDWQTVRSYATSNQYQWNSNGAAPGTVYFGVWAKDAASTTSSFDANASTPYVVARPSCGSVGLSVTPPPPSTSGAQVTFTATASACPNPLYLFVMRRANSSTWQTIRGYSTNNQFRWNSTGASPGAVYFGVWAKDAASSTASFDANASMPYAVSAAPCASVSIAASPASPSAAGTQVTFTATASGCTDPNPLFLFVMRPASSNTWQTIQAYSTNNQFHWNSTGASAGSVYFGVWVKDAASSTVSFDANASVPYVVR